MMKLVGARWHCLPCNVNNAEVEAERKSGPRYGMGLGLGFRGIPMWVRVVLGILVASTWMLPKAIKMYGKRHVLMAMSEPAEAWSTKPVGQWPPLTLINDLELKGMPKSAGSLGFLIQTKSGAILGATHNMREALGDKKSEPSMTNAELNQHFVSWRMSPTGAADRAIAFTGFHGEPSETGDGDVWLLQTNADKNSLPVTPLKLRSTPVVRGMRLFVIARPANDPSGKEQAFPCQVHTVAFNGEVLALVYEKAVPGGGFAGAPVVDVHGHLAGIVVGAADDPRSDGMVLWLEATGAAELRQLVD